MIYIHENVPTPGAEYVEHIYQIKQSVSASANSPINPERIFQLDDLVVKARRGSTAQTPIREFSSDDIAMIGGWAISDVLNRLAQNGQVGEEPLVLVNGRRIPNVGAFTGFPPDALERIEILSDDGGHEIGARAGQGVINIVLKRRYSNYDAQITSEFPTHGAYSVLNVNGRRSNINDLSTYKIDVKLSGQDELRSDEIFVNDDILNAYSVRPSVKSISADFSWSKPINNWMVSSIFQGQSRETEMGLRSGSNSVNKRSAILANVAASGQIGNAQIQTDLNAEFNSSDVRGVYSSKTRSYFAGISSSVNYRPNDGLFSNWVLSYRLRTSLLYENSSFNDIGYRDYYYNIQQDGDISVPWLRKGDNCTEALCINAINTTIGYSMSGDESGVGSNLYMTNRMVFHGKLKFDLNVQQRSDPISNDSRLMSDRDSSPVSVYDYRSNRWVLVNTMIGPPSNLIRPQSRTFSANLSAGPYTKWQIFLNANYSNVKTSNLVGPLPEPTAEIENIFPDRFARNNLGELIGVDTRPINFDYTFQDSFSMNMDISLPNGIFDSSTSIRAGVNYSIILRNRMSILPEFPVQDRLAGDGGGLSRQNLRFFVDYRKRHFRVNSSVSWRDGSRSRQASFQDSPYDIIRRPYMSVDFRIGRQWSSPVFWRRQERESNISNREVVFEVINALDQRPRGGLANGDVASGFGRTDQDPVGRRVRVSLRQRF